MGCHTQLGGLLRVGLPQNRLPLDVLRRIIYSPPEKVRSQFNATYAVLLNLYRQMGEGLLQIYPKSFHYFQTNQKQRAKAVDSLKNKLQLLKTMNYIDEKGLTARGLFASKIYGYELPLTELFVEGFFESAQMEDIACVLSAITFEPRKGYEFSPLLPDSLNTIRKRTRKLSKRITKMEMRFRLDLISPKFHYHLAPSVIEWIQGTPFEKLPSLSDVDEGEIVRNFRMIIQLARELVQTEGISGSVKAKLSTLLSTLKRDVVDAERQLTS